MDFLEGGENLDLVINLVSHFYLTLKIVSGTLGEVEQAVTAEKDSPVPLIFPASYVVNIKMAATPMMAVAIQPRMRMGRLTL
jgi:hypothetical protein